jgi:hypothetical protein
MPLNTFWNSLQMRQRNLAATLEEEGLVRNLGIHSRAYTGKSENSKISITHDGIDEVEDAVERPASPTQHFPANSINYHIGGDFIGRDKAGGDIAHRDIYKSQGNMTINQNQIGELKDIIAELRKIQGQPELSDEKKDELEAEILTIESQTKSPKPKSQIIKDALSSAKGIIEQASGVAVAAAPLVARIASWLSVP